MHLVSLFVHGTCCKHPDRSLIEPSWFCGRHSWVVAGAGLQLSKGCVWVWCSITCRWRRTAMLLGGERAAGMTMPYWWVLDWVKRSVCRALI
jgi:hypothetical protein